jgi:hypothetical protein
MLITDFCNQPYVAEVLKTSTSGAERAPEVIERLIDGKWRTEKPSSDANDITVHHGYVASPIQYHRTTRKRTDVRGAEIEIPRIKNVRGKEYFLYDLLVLTRRQHVVVAVPFHALAGRIFLKIDDALAGTKAMYETMDITRMVIQLGAAGRIIIDTQTEIPAEIVVTRCHLAFSYPSTRSRDIEQVRLTGSNLGKSKVYSDLVQPVLNPNPTDVFVTPTLLGFALVIDHVRKTSATTDRHGNFKITVGPGLRHVTRLFSLLDEIERLEGVVSTSGNVPILQSASIKEVE